MNYQPAMGNEKSLPNEIKSEGIIEQCELWTQEAATLINSRVCVFKQCLKEASELQSLSQNLKLYRHPNILRFVSTWTSKGILYVVTEEVWPLNQVVRALLPIQLSIGLQSILNALIFLRQKASKSLNNLTLDSIYVNREGYWKLGRVDSMTSLQSPYTNNDAQGFVALAHEILSHVDESDDSLKISEFRNYCTEHVSDEYFLEELASHSFFNHEFINIYTFLVELPAKSEEEKSAFFETLAVSLNKFPEKLVAQQLGTLLLSRLVLLNEVAQSHLLPKIFIVKCDHNESLFSQDIFNEYLRPKLLNMFGIRDSQIRLILLRYFSSLCLIFTKEQLESRILPELLAGVRDTNEQLVSATLHSLADLVPVLGASVVVGQHRTKLFADGRPFTNLTKLEDRLDRSYMETPPSVNSFLLTERQSPDGDEDHDVSTKAIIDITVQTQPPTSEIATVESVEDNVSKLILSSHKPHYSPQLRDDDLHLLDIKSSRTKKDTTDDIELLFKDLNMEPVILQTATVNISDVSPKVQKNKFEAVDVDSDDINGWEDDESELAL